MRGGGREQVQLGAPAEVCELVLLREEPAEPFGPATHLQDEKLVVKFSVSLNKGFLREYSGAVGADRMKGREGRESVGLENARQTTARGTCQRQNSFVVQR